MIKYITSILPDFMTKEGTSILPFYVFHAWRVIYQPLHTGYPDPSSMEGPVIHGAIDSTQLMR
jgi:hypothetical protein